jgi:predicted MFS family arabinose efflux permease
MKGNKTISSIQGQWLSRKKQVVISLIILLTLFTDSISVKSTSLLAPFLRSELNINTVQIGYLISSFMLGTMLTALPLGSFMGRVNVRLAYGIVLAFIGLCYWIIAYINSYKGLLSLLFIIGMLRSGIVPLSIRMITEIFGSRRRGFATAIIFGAFPAGGFLGGVILPLLGSAFDSRAAYIFIGILSVLSGIAALIFLTRQSPSSNKAIPRRNWASLGTPAFVVLAAAYGSFSLGMTTQGFITLYLVDSLKLTALLAGTFFGLIFLVGIVGRLIWGFLGDRYFSHNRWWLLTFTSALLAISIILLASLDQGSPSWLIILTMVGIGLSAASSWTIMTPLLGDVIEVSAVASGTAVIFFLTNITDSGGPVMFGKLFEWTGSYQTTIAYFLAFPVIAMICFLWMAVLNSKKKVDKLLGSNE